MRLTRALSGFATALAVLTASVAAYAGTVVSQKLPSPTLGRDWVYNVYLPDGYDTGKLRYPVMYLLHGNGGDENEWVAKGEAQKTIDRLIADGLMPELHRAARRLSREEDQPARPLLVRRSRRVPDRVPRHDPPQGLARQQDPGGAAHHRRRP